MAKIALLFSGLSRQWSHCYKSQLNLFNRHQTDVFFHFWDTVDAVEKGQIVEAYKPKAYCFAQPQNFDAAEKLISNRDNINSPARLFSQYYGWYAVDAIYRDFAAKTGTKYDLAVRIRADLMFFHSLDDSVDRMEPNDLLVSSHNNFGVINDMFAVGGIEPIHWYMSLFEHALRHKDEVVFNPENLLLHHLNKRANQYRYFQAPIVILVFRPHMVGMPIEECLKEHPGMSKWKDPEIVASHKDSHRKLRGEAGEHHVERFKEFQLALMEREKIMPTGAGTTHLAPPPPSDGGLAGGNKVVI